MNTMRQNSHYICGALHRAADNVILELEVE